MGFEWLKMKGWGWEGFWVDGFVFAGVWLDVLGLRIWV